ncbi:MAG: S-adenosylmethionine:tRNA ribosyltransferase-isomerase [Nannocystaceae bacterium]
MNPATAPRDDRAATRLLVVDPAGSARLDTTVAALPRLLRAGDLLIVNDAATLPASLRARDPAGASIELRLTGAGAPGRWPAILLGAGDWRTPTERRPPPPRLVAGDRLTITDQAGAGDDLAATILAVDPRTPRLVTLAFDQDEDVLWDSLYRRGVPVQYAYQEAPLALWSVQSAFAARPWAAEMPSAGRPLEWRTLGALRRAGVGIAWLTHAAGLSSSGDPTMDQLLPLPERYAIPEATVAAIATAEARGGRIIAVGTTVVRALEGCLVRHGQLRAGVGVTDLRIGPTTPLRVIDGILTGMHAPGESHHALLGAFADEATLLGAWRHAEGAGYLAHEFGDSMLLLPAVARSRSARAA